MLGHGLWRGTTVKKNRKKELLTIMILILLVGAMVLVCKIQIRDGGIYVENPLFNSYAYTMYSDHVVLEKFQGEEQEEIVIPTEIWGKPVTVIGWRCFERRKEIERVIFHENIVMIDGFAFEGCANLIEVVNGSNVERINTQAFSGCKKLQRIDVGTHLEVIGLAAFDMCESLKKMGEQENLVCIEDYAFNKSGLEEFIFNCDVKIGSGVFANTPWLSRQEEFVIYGDGDLVWYNGNCEEVFVPREVKVLLLGCFEGTTADVIYLPDTVTEIQEFTFSKCADVKVYIPESVVKMGNKEENYNIVNSDAYITIITTQDSYAQQYAIEHDIPYEIVEPW